MSQLFAKLLQSLGFSLSNKKEHAHCMCSMSPPPSKKKEACNTCQAAFGVPGVRDSVTRAVRAALRKARAEGTPLPSQQPPGAAPGHMALLSWLRTAAPGDAWLLREWGDILVAQRRFDEAATHFEARPHPITVVTSAAVVAHCAAALTLRLRMLFLEYIAWRLLRDAREVCQR